jgi:hypothetical protein
MVRTRRIFTCVGLAFAAACSDSPTAPLRTDAPSPRFTQAPAGVTLTCPHLWKTYTRGNGVLVCGEPFTTGVIAFVDLQRGARIQNLVDQRGLPTAKAPSPLFVRHPITWWWDVTKHFVNPMCVFNGGFFETRSPQTELSFPLKSANSVVTAGALAPAQTNRERKMLSITGGEAVIQPYTLTTNDLSKVSNALRGRDVIVGYAPSALNSLTNWTLIGIRDGNNDTHAETLIIFAASLRKPSGAASVLAGLGAKDVILLDGGRSTQYMCKLGSLNWFETVPHAIGVLAAPN